MPNSKHITADQLQTSLTKVKTEINKKQDSITTLPLANGGTGASTAANARTNLGLGSAATQNYAAYYDSGAPNNLLTAAAIANYISNKQWYTATGTLTSSGWSNSQQSLTVAGMTSASVGTVGLAMSATDAQRKAAAKIHVSAQGTDSVTFTADTVPTVDIPIVVNLQPA